MRAIVCACVLACGCGRGTGDLVVELVAEDTISDGLASGSADEDVVDGWAISFDRYVVVVSEVRVSGGPGPEERADPSIAVDLVRSGTIELARLSAVEAGAWAEVRFRTPAADASTMRHASVEEADLSRMVAERCTYLVAGALAGDAGGTIAFDLCVPADTAYGPCESDTGIEGITVAAGTTTAMNFTIHGDHLFFNGFPSGAEGSVARRAQWLADADADGDGRVGRAELEAIGPADLGTLFPADPGDGHPGFNLGGTPIPLETAWDYVRAQLTTQGHFQGEGECPARPL